MRRFRLPVPVLVLFLASMAGGNPPLWWSEAHYSSPELTEPDIPPVLNTNPANHRGPANIGQAKHMARSALAALRSVHPAAATAIEADLVGPGKPIPHWNPPANQAERDINHAPLLTGQLKAIAHPFYTHLHAAAPDWLASQRAANGTEHGGIFPWTDDLSDDNHHAMASIGQLKAVFSLDFAPDADNDGVPDEWERHFARLLWEDFGVSAPTNPLEFDVNADYAGHGSSAYSIYHGLDASFELATTEVVTTPSVEGSMKSIEHRKAGFVGFPELEAPPLWLETGPKIDFYRKLRTDFQYDYGEEQPLVGSVFAWIETHGRCIENQTYAWSPENGWQTNQWKDVQNYTDEMWQWWRDIPDSPENWYLHDYSGQYFPTYEVQASGDPPALPNNSVVGQWTTNTPTLRIGSGAEHSTGTQVTNPNPGAGYSPTYRTSETFSLTQELSEPYSTNDLILDAQRALAAAPAAMVVPVAGRNLVENETKISLAGGQYRLSWSIPANTPVPPGNNLVKAVFIWQELTDPEPTPNGTASRSVQWRNEVVHAAPGALAQTRWQEFSPPQDDGISWVRPVTPNGAITLPNAILVNKDDDDGNSVEDRIQNPPTFAAENDLIELNFQAKAPGPDEADLIYRLEASGGAKVRFWQVYPNQPPQALFLPYRLQARDYTGSNLARPTYFIEAIEGGSLVLNHSRPTGRLS